MLEDTSSTYLNNIRQVEPGQSSPTTEVTQAPSGQLNISAPSLENGNSNRGTKFDQDKPDLSLLPKIFLEEVARAFMVGERKYGRYNYCKGHKASQLTAAAMRHLASWNEGEELDPKDGQHHLGAAGACIAMLLREVQLSTLEDNRFKKNKNV